MRISTAAIDEVGSSEPGNTQTSADEGLIDMWLAEEGFIDKSWPGISVGQVADLNGATWGRLDGASALEEEHCQQIGAWRQRPLVARFPYVLFGGLNLRRKRGADVVKLPILVAIGVAETGDREVLAVSQGRTDDRDSWAAFLRTLSKRGLNGVQLFISSERYPGLGENLALFYPEAFWQASGLHFPQRLDVQVPYAQT